MVVILRLLKIISCLLVVFLVFANLIRSEGVASNGEITLIEAIDIGFERAKEWNVNATLTSVNSVDETMGGSRGAAGKRFRWAMIFIVPGTDDYAIIDISKRKIIGFRPGKQTPGPTIAFDKIKLDSADVLQLAKDKFGLKQGKDWATGYHFTLDNIDGTPILTVVGNDQDNRFTRISFNAENKEVVSAIHKLPYGGGLISKRMDTDTLTKKGMAITGVVAGKNNLVVWGDKKPTQFSTTQQPFIELIDNNGETWTELKVNDYLTHAWFDKNDQLYVATEKELSAGVTSNNKGTKILSLDHMIEDIDYSSNNHIAVLSNGSIYYTTNQGKRWEHTKIPKPLYAVQISDNGDLLGLTDERKILQKTNDKWTELKTPNSNDVPDDMKVVHNQLFISTENGIWTRDLQQENWRKIQIDEMVFKLISFVNIS